jgi:hypothetical protein
MSIEPVILLYDYDGLGLILAFPGRRPVSQPGGRACLLEV